MRHAYIVTLFIALLSGPALAAPDSVTIAFVTQTQAEIFNERWDDANQRCDNFQKSRPPNAAVARLMRAAALQARMFAEEDDSQVKRFSSLLDTAERILSAQLARAPRGDSAMLCLFLGNCLSMRALMESKFGSLVSAVRRGMRAHDVWKRGFTADSSLPDLRLGLGGYMYWKSATIGFLSWTGLVADSRLLGIAETSRAGHSGLMSQDAAKSALVWMLLREKQYDSAIALAEDLRSRHPHGATFLWPLAELYKQSGQLARAKDIYLLIRENLLRRPGNYLNLVRVDYELVTLARELKDPATLSLVADGFERYATDTPRWTRRRLQLEYRALARL